MKYAKNPSQAAGASLVMGGVALMATISVAALLPRSPEGSASMTSAWTMLDSSSTSHATAIPWLSTPEACLQTSREWRDGQCWDGEHSPTF